MRLEIGRYIVIDDEVCHGKPVFKGTRVLVSDVVELLGAGVSIEEIVRDYYPSLNEEMIREALRYFASSCGWEGIQRSSL
jgi:uncharacterized protein (DUF433 family)